MRRSVGHRRRRRYSVHGVHAGERAPGDRARGSQGADRGRERLVSRRLEERGPRQDRLRAPVRTLDVQRHRELRRRVLQALRPGRRHRAERHDLARSHQLFSECARDGRRPRAVDGIRPHGSPPRRGHAGTARRAARRRAERETPGREPALRQSLRGAAGEPVSLRSSLFLGDDRFDGGPERGLARGRAGVVRDLLRPEQCGAGAGGRHHARRGAREGRALFRRHPVGTADHEVRHLGARTRGEQAARHAGPRAAGAPVQDLGRAALDLGGRGPARSRRRHPVHRQDLAAVPAARLRRPDRHGRRRDAAHLRDRRHHRHRCAGLPWRRPRRRGTGHRRGNGAAHEGRAHRGGSGAGRDADSRADDPRARAGRRLRRQGTAPGRERHVRRRSGLLQGVAGAHGESDTRSHTRRGAPLVRRALVHAGGTAFRRAQRASRRHRPQQRTADAGQLPRRRLRRLRTRVPGKRHAAARRKT